MNLSSARNLSNIDGIGADSDDRAYMKSKQLASTALCTTTSPRHRIVDVADVHIVVGCR